MAVRDLTTHAIAAMIGVSSSAILDVDRLADLLTNPRRGGFF